MHTRSLVALLALLTFVPSSASAFVDGEGTEFVEQQVWYHGAQTPIGTLDHQLGSEIAWSAEPPSGIGATLGNNYSTFLELVEPGMREANTFTARGTFTGELSTIAVDLYYTGATGGVCGMSLAWDLEIDGVEVLWTDQASPSANLNQETADRGIYRVRFMFTRVDEIMDVFGVASGPGVEHDIYLNFANFYACNEAVWLYDHEAVPSGMIFNLDPASPEAAACTEVDVFDPPPPLPA